MQKEVKLIEDTIHKLQLYHTATKDLFIGGPIHSKLINDLKKLRKKFDALNAQEVSKC